MEREPRSRLFRRCCPRRGGAFGKASQLKFPDTPLVLAGALGGPFCIFTLTPLRNALTLASQDASKSAWEIYKCVFSGGFSSGWTGGTTPLIPACPQFCIMGPLFHMLKEALGSVPLAVVCAAIAETTISFGSQTVNSQMAFNQQQRATGGPEVPLSNPFIPYGPGMMVHVCRNVVAMSGIRIFSPICQSLLIRLLRVMGVEMPEGLRQFVGDFVASMGAAVCSAPLNQCYNFAVTSEAYMHGSSSDRFQELCGFLSRSYLKHGVSGEVLGLSPTLARDLMMRCAYVAMLYSLFGFIERSSGGLTQVIRNMRKRRGSEQEEEQPSVGRRATIGVRATAEAPGGVALPSAGVHAPKGCA
eukprot:CAMPEP_0204130168 /NCGR_PEP_ID=MMETSP0361-20130328/13193_1 /ASSEMBLY_ACC=CAM_ASM_000343 /TAXON_ID=268821 /ORGANISM="Scrippsiella Hangoei, Strain SHTV-5" /LENGTH=357 /DNA_ID=CAMNT_0051082689 /DNA_START=83 /DNA_END=1154 /DNA_ORIENTATION=+